ncbi:achaete-scute homolog 1-like, partial [Aricia agestis]|uniref:achaete-scute homolog 1-like n=1 Tax=Aricia agestis TaxID=91739 RepID=UPI001C2081BE
RACARARHAPHRRASPRYLVTGVCATSANPPPTSAARTRALVSVSSTTIYAMPMAAVHPYQNLGVSQKLTQLQTVPRRLAPAPVDTNRCKKKTYLQTYPSQPASVARRNARERNRVKQVNNGFAALRQHIPSAVTAALAGGRGSSRKLSKVDTLRLAVEYIRSLKRLLDESDEGCSESQMGLSLVSNGPQTPPSSEESHSPAPSLVSEGSIGQNCHDTYEPMSPEDEELLDAISWWQQQ